MLTKRVAIILTTAITALYAICDFMAPGEINVAILYASSVAVSGWSRSHRFIWLTTALCVALTYAGVVFGPRPPALVLVPLYINRTFVALGLLMVAAIVHQRLTAIKEIERTRNLQIHHNEMLRQVAEERRRLNDELESRVASELKKRLEVEESLQQAHKMEAIGQFTAGIAHDFNNFLTTVIGNLGLILARTAVDDPRRRLTENALNGAEQGSRLTKQLLSFASRHPVEPKVVEIDGVLNEVLAQARPVVSEAIELSLEVDAGLWRCNVDQAQFESALLNLVINARDATPGKGRIAISAANATIAPDAADLPSGEYIHLSVTDGGSGMPPEVRARVFEPFFTTKSAGKGSGLGLSMVYGFAKRSRGTVRIDSVLNRGTTVHLYLPRTTSPSASKATSRNLPPPAHNDPATVAIAEHDEGADHVARQSG